MARKSPSRKSLARKGKERARPVPPPNFPPEERRAEVATVAWMLCALFTLCAEVVGLIARIALAYFNEAEAGQTAWTLLPDVTLVMALVTGLLCLVLTGVVYRLRKTPPPVAITVVAVLLGLTPWMRLILAWLRGV